MKRIIPICLSVLLTSAMFACGGGETPPPAHSADGYVFTERNIKTVGQTYEEGDVKYPDELWQKPDFEYCPSLDFGGVGDVKGIFFTSPVTYQGKKTKVAAYIGFPEGASAQNKVPAIVLVHGGLGTAIPDWVKYWNDLGFAALSLATEGGEPTAGVCNVDNRHNERNRFENDAEFTAGPTNVGFSDRDLPLTEQWFYHATSSVICAVSLISSFDCVDVQRVGITGVSWGGMITCTVCGYDDRLSFGIPVYGALTLTRSCSGFATIYPDAQVAERWDTSAPLAQSACKMFMVNSVNDFAFSFDASSRCSKAAGGFCLFKKNFPHGQEIGATEENIPFFARYFCGMDSEFVEVMHSPSREDPTLALRPYGNVEIQSIKIYYTDSQKPDASAAWDSKAVPLVQGCYEYSLNVPDSTYAYVQIKYNNNLEVSSYLF